MLTEKLVLKNPLLFIYKTVGKYMFILLIDFNAMFFVKIIG
jgi:hypothetical protein